MSCLGDSGCRGYRVAKPQAFQRSALLPHSLAELQVITLSGLASPAPKTGPACGCSGRRGRGWGLPQESRKYGSLEECQFRCRIAPTDQRVFCGRDHRVHAERPKTLRARCVRLNTPRSPSSAKQPKRWTAAARYWRASASTRAPVQKNCACVAHRRPERQTTCLRSTPKTSSSAGPLIHAGGGPPARVRRRPRV